jgi:hypothetical protein
MADESNLRHILDLARAEINRQQPHLALPHLKTIWPDLDDFHETPLWAEAQLTYAEALAATNDPGAEAEFNEALKRISELPEPNPGLKMRAHEHLACHLARKRASSRAREHYHFAQKLAVDSGLEEDASRVHLCTIALDLESDQGAQRASFQNLKKAAAEYGATWKEQLLAWMRYLGELQEQERGLLNARQRGVASVEYFHGVLSAIRNNAHEIAS